MRILKVYEHGLRWVLRHPADHVADHDWNCVSQRLLVHHRAEGILSAAGYGAHQGSVQAAQDISFAAMSEKMTQFVRHRRSDPAVRA